MSAITFTELSYRVEASGNPAREKESLSALVEDIPVVPFDDAAAFAYGPIRLTTRESNKDQLDKMIAAHSKALRLTLVTNNLKDFEKYPGIVTENWLEPVG